MAGKFLRKVAEFQEADRQASGTWPVFRAHLNLKCIAPTIYHHLDSISVYVHIAHAKQAKQLLIEVRSLRITEARHDAIF